MHEKELINMLGVARGEVDAPLFRSALRRAVLTKRTRFAPLQSFLTILSMNKYYVSLGSVAAVVAIALVVAVSPLSTKVVSAQEQVNRAFTRAIAISPDMRAQLESKMKADMLETLKEAKAAPDLKVMTREEYEKDAQFSFSRGPMLAPAGAIGAGTVTVGTAQAIKVKNLENGELPPEGASFTVINSDNMQPGVAAEGGADDILFTATAAAPLEEGVAVKGTFSAGTFMAGGPGESFEPVKYLSYTDPQGNKVVLGLDKNDTPVFKMATLSASAVQKMEDGSIKIEGKQINMTQVQKAKTVQQEN